MENPRGIRVGTALGAPVLLMPSWFVIAGIVTLLYAPQVRDRFPWLGAGAFAVAFVAALLLLLSVFLHELAHVAAARVVGVQPTHIALDLWGGHTAFADEMPTPGRSAFVSLVGPATNAVIAAAAWALLGLAAPGGIVELLLLGLMLTNAFVAVFNALPGLPLDGGRALEALVWRVTGNRTTGTLAAGWFGRLGALAVAAWVLWQLFDAGPTSVFSSVWLLLIAGLMWQGASAAIRHARWRQRATSVVVRDLHRPAVAVGADVPLAEAIAAGRRAGVPDVVLIGDGGRPEAVLDRGAAAAVPPERAFTVPARAVGRALGPAQALPEQLAGDDLLRSIQASPQPEYPVVDADGRVVGVLSWEAIASTVAGR